ncbi:MAG: Ig-like domain-containing protein, partial [Pirellulaceae bacterium]
MDKHLVSVVLASLLACSLQAAPVVFPEQVTLVGPESSQQLVVTADRNQKQSVDLTRKVVYRSSNPAIATVSGRGLV